MRQIEILNSADLDLRNIEDYILKNWSFDVLSDFYEKYDRALEILSLGKVVFLKYEDTGFRKYILTKHNTIIYKVEEHTVYIIRILQNFQDPEENYNTLKQ